MLIDFHTHVFPDQLAPRAIASLAAACGEAPATNGTAAGLVASMKAAGITHSVTLPVLTKPSQFDTVNAFAASLAAIPGVIPFGGMHPDDGETDAHLDRIVSLGLRGIKLHPAYQNTFADDERYIRLIRGAVERGLVVLLHSGFDAGLPDPIYCTPERAARMLDLVGNAGHGRIVLAHSGANRFPDGVIRYLAGRDVYFDISYTLWYDDLAQTKRVIDAHGAKRILFATDCPWNDQTEDVRRLDMLGLTQDEREDVAWRNAARLLRMSEDEFASGAVR